MQAHHRRLNPMHEPQLLILHPDPEGLALLTAMLKASARIIEATDDRRAVRLLGRESIDALVAGVDPADGDALELLRFVWRARRDVPVILLFRRPHPERAREALRRGATAVLRYPVPAAELRAAVSLALQPRGPRTGQPAAPDPRPSAGRQPRPLPAAPSGPMAGPDTRPGAPPPGNSILYAASAGALAAASVTAAAATHRLGPVAGDLILIGNDPAWRQVLDLAGRVAATPAPALIGGEPGTGKSTLARLIHALASGPQRPFVIIEAAELADPAGMHETAIPGVDPTDAALIAWLDKLSRARGGTLYLDGVAALPAALQDLLLRELRVRDDGASPRHPAPRGGVRFLASTGGDLEASIDRGQFSRELYHRLGAITLGIPPLRHRGDDVELLAEAFRARHAAAFRKGVIGFAGEALKALRRHTWPGNVRELEAAVRRAVALCRGPRIDLGLLAPALDPHHWRGRGGIAPRPRPPAGLRTLREALEEPEKQIIIEALRAFDWRRREVAAALGVNRTTLYKKMRRYRLLLGEPVGAD
jgi:two-component system response regulator HydG